MRCCVVCVPLSVFFVACAIVVFRFLVSPILIDHSCFSLYLISFLLDLCRFDQRSLSSVLFGSSVGFFGWSSVRSAVGLLRLVFGL